MKIVATSKLGKAERDIVALGIALAAVILFVATGSSVLPGVVRSLLGIGAGPDKMLSSALLLNIALIIFGWRRYRELTEEISERKSAEEKARILSETDPLTGCLNRRALADASETLRYAAHARGQAIAFAMVDLDDFKKINDLSGHLAGDRVLTEVARRIHALLPVDALLARIGGDEFAFVVPYKESQSKQIDALVSSIFEACRESLNIGHGSTGIAMSIGIANDSGHDLMGQRPDVHELMHRADIAMYQAKKLGKNRYFWFEQDMERKLKQRTQLESRIRQGLANNEFQPFYEQQVDLETGEILGFEMLARWISPELGVVMPDAFIRVAEDMGVITQLSEKLMTQALEDAQQWDPALTLSFNISPVQLSDPWFAERFLKLLVRHNFPPERIELDIAESCLHENTEQVQSIITSLRNQGVRISLDDFGKGLSSLDHLRSLSFDRVKIDRSFVTGMHGEEANSKIVDAIVSLGADLNVSIAAEGVEDQAILQTLRTMGKLKGQGYLYGQPESAKQVSNRLAVVGKLRCEAELPEAEGDFDQPQPVDATIPMNRKASNR